jgi:methyl-accepting chemotaxis protein
VFTIFNGTDQLFITVIIAIAAVVVERLIEYTQFSEFFAMPPDYAANNTAVFSYIDLYREIEKINLGLIRQLSESQSGMLSQFETTNKETNDIMEKIDGYVQLQNAECQKLLERKNDMDNFFGELSGRAEDFCYTFQQYKERLENSSGALTYYAESESLIADINESFQSRYKQSANDFMRRIEDTEYQLRRVVGEYSKFNDFIQPHAQKISVYNARMDSILQALENGIDSKRMMLEKTSKEIAAAVGEANGHINETLMHLNVYLNKNVFVLSKILETYQTSPLTPRRLRKLLKSWPATTKKE